MVKVKEWRQGLGVTQKALAEASGLDIRWIQKLEVGDSGGFLTCKCMVL